MFRFITKQHFRGITLINRDGDEGKQLHYNTLQNKFGVL